MKKKIVTIGILCSAMFTFAQSQRIQLYEEFTGENCGPCASLNPGLNALLDANTSKIIAIKYQLNIPAVNPTPPLFTQNKPEANGRKNYYSVNSAPMGRHDGIAYPGAYPGYVTYMDQAKIDAEDAVISPFTVNITHSYSPNEDSVYITGAITASMTYTATGTLKLQLVMVEKEIIFSVAPGLNGEKNFYNVMRKMIPDVNGTILNATWSNGQVYTISEKAGIPTYIYDKNQIAIVAFVQQDGDKSVLQAALSEPISSSLLVENRGGIEGSFAVYPNPFTDKTSIEFNLNQAENIKIIIYNVLGTVVYASDKGILNAGTHKIEINAGDLSSGIYTFKLITGDNNTVTKKVSIEK